MDSDTSTDQEISVETDLQNILVTIASIGPDADRDSLISTIDQSIEAIIVALLAQEGPKSPAPDLTKTAATTMELLEACAETDDEEFRDHIANRARELLAVVTSGKGLEVEPEPADPSLEVLHDVFDVLYGDFNLDWRGKEPAGEKPYFTIPMVSRAKGKTTTRFVSRQYFESTSRFGEETALKDDQREAPFVGCASASL